MPSPILPPTDKAPRLTIVMNELGGDKAVTASLLALKLPITFSVLPFAKDAAATATAAHEAGQEVPCGYADGDDAIALRQGGPRRNHHEDVRGRHADPDGRRPRPCAPTPRARATLWAPRLTTDTAATRRFCEILARSGLYVLDDVTHQESILYAEARRRGLPAWRRALTLNDGPKKPKAPCSPT